MQDRTTISLDSVPRGALKGQTMSSPGFQPTEQTATTDLDPEGVHQQSKRHLGEVRPMSNERGAAIAIVLLVLGLVSLVAAGLMVQRRFDNYFNVAQANFERMFNLADGAASLAFSQVGLKESVEYSGGQSTELVYYADDSDKKTLGDWQSRVTLKGYETDPRLLSGWELGTAEGYHVQFWMAQGSGNTAVNLRSFKTAAEEADWRNRHPLPTIAVFIAATKFARNL